VDSAVKNIASLCTGVGMLDEAVRLGCEHLGWRTRLAMCAEWEAYAAACLRSRMEESSMESAPIWCGDFADFDAAAFCGVVDILTAGFPCQPWSAAGKQEGTADERWVWPSIANVIREMGPRFVFLENVPGVVSGGGLDHCLSDIASMRFDAQWLSVTAKAAHASHLRERVFVLAYSPGERFPGDAKQDKRSIERKQQPSRRRDTGGRDSTVAVAKRNGRRKRQPGRGQDQRAAIGRAGGNVDDSRGFGASVPGASVQRQLEQQQGRPVESGRRCSGVFAPGPTADWRSIPEHLYPSIEPGFRLMADGMAVVLDESRADALRCAGNGVVAIQGAVAFVELARRAGLARRVGS